MKMILTLIAVLSFLLVGSPSVNAEQKELEEIRDAIHVKGARWVADETSMSKLSHKERKIRCGLLDSSIDSEYLSSESTVLSFPYVGSAPASFDWRNTPDGKNYVTKVKDQGSCGSCWAFATTAALESNVYILDTLDSDEAEQILVSCSNAGSCAGGYITLASSFIQSTGLPPEKDDPYTAKNTPCKKATKGWQSDTYNIFGWTYAASPSADAMKSWIYNYGPIVVGMHVYSDFMYYNGGIYSYTSGRFLGNHAVLIVGYNDIYRYFIVKNSWGSQWAESGYFRIDYSELTSAVGLGYQTIVYLH